MVELDFVLLHLLVAVEVATTAVEVHTAQAEAVVLVI